MRETRGFGVGILNYVYWTFSRECDASLNAREHAGEKKIDMGKNV